MLSLLTHSLTLNHLLWWCCFLFNWICMSG